jgi:CheY-like chemotaxis protein/HPt (histidine-containing phosphotransfer) domain-containing protein
LLPTEPYQHILVAEDNLVNQRVVLHLLTKIGYQATFVQNGRDAVQLAQSQPFTCILMDMMMPVMDGLEAARAIRKNESSLGKRIPIIAFTANADSTDERRCIEAGMDAFISKPFTFDQLKNRLQSILGPLSSETTPSAIDFAVLNTFVRTMGEEDVAFIRELFCDFMTEANRVRTDIHVGIRSADPNIIALSAHSLKGSSAVLGAEKLVHLCQEIESLAKRNNLSDIELRLSHFEGAVNEVRRALDTYLQQLNSTSA